MININDIVVKQGTIKDFKKYWLGSKDAKPQFAKHIEDGNCIFWYAKMGKKYIGTVYFFKNLDDKSAADGKVNCYLCNLFVFPEYRKNGIGTMLIETAKNYAKTLGFNNLTLCVDEDETANVRLYTELGFTNQTGVCDFDLVYRKDGAAVPTEQYILISCDLQ